MLIRNGIVRPAALAAVIGMGFSSCAPVAKPLPGETPTPTAASADIRPAAEVTPAEEPAANPPINAGVNASDFSLTIFSTADPATFNPQDLLQAEANQIGSNFAPGYAVVRETRRLKLDSGANRIELSDVAARIDPTTVSLQFLTAPKSVDVLEQNFEFDMASPEKLLQKYVGRDVVLTLKGNSSNASAIHGRLISVSNAACVIQTADAQTPIIIQRIDGVDNVHLAQPKSATIVKPTLSWNVYAEKPGEQQVQISYQTDGVTWRADYNVVMAADEKTADLSAWVTAVNASGLSYPESKLKLVAGDVDRLETRYGSGGVGTGNFDRHTIVRDRGFSNYHVYAVNHPTSLPNNSTKQIELFPPKTAVPFSKNYVYDGIPDEVRQTVPAEPNMQQNFGAGTKSSVGIYAGFQNGQAEHLGMPLPAGRVRLYRIDPADGSREFVGEDVIGHTSKDDAVLLRLAAASDIVGERRQIDFKEGDKSQLESFEIKLRNRKAEAVHVIVNEDLYRWTNWEITQSSDKWERKDHRTIYIPVDVPANGEKVVTYSVKYSW